MAEPSPHAPGRSVYEESMSLLRAAPQPPQLLIVDTYEVLWPGGPPPAGPAAALPASAVYPDAVFVLSAARAAGIPVAVVGACPSTSELQGALEVSGLQPLIQHVHALEVDSSTELLLQGPVQPTAEHQKALEQHWRGVRALTGIPGSASLAFLGTASALRAANRTGIAACVLVKPGAGVQQQQQQQQQGMGQEQPGGGTEDHKAAAMQVDVQGSAGDDNGGSSSNAIGSAVAPGAGAPSKAGGLGVAALREALGVFAEKAEGDRGY